MVYSLFIIVVVGILFLIFYNLRGARKSSRSARQRTKLSPGPQDEEARREVHSNALTPGQGLSRSGSAKVEVPPPSEPAAEPPSRLRSTGGDEEYRQALRSLAAQPKEQSYRQQHLGDQHSAPDESYREALRRLADPHEPEMSSEEMGAAANPRIKSGDEEVSKSSKSHE
ncbi:hypothetical protein DCC85_20725 [Paenibacillus sp. CAA11]|uniref:hypothetical protein n=1 Tax=Paenibacillus sp. CAA11 TaxID=1532905 RepID=UPI000D3941D4|nr:hypothetical protein [Paenibacillus sp. CAA11]AWB46350.1 hypothetical protein DCC85_20725 [Paenibacillus sp. CAA11]